MPGDIARYQIDYTLVKNIFKKQVNFSKSYPSADCDSHHNLLVMKCELRYRKRKNNEKTKYCQYNIQSLKNEETVKKYREQLEMNYQNYQNKDFNVPITVNQKWQNIKSVIRSAADDTFGEEGKSQKNAG